MSTASDDAPVCDSERVLDALGDTACRRIIGALDEPLTARELVDRCDGSRSTVYRKLDSLVESGLLERHNRIRTDGTNATEFELAVDSVNVEFIGEAEISVDISE